MGDDRKKGKLQFRGRRCLLQKRGPDGRGQVKVETERKG